MSLIGNKIRDSVVAMALNFNIPADLRYDCVYSTAKIFINIFKSK